MDRTWFHASLQLDGTEVTLNRSIDHNGRLEPRTSRRASPRRTLIRMITLMANHWKVISHGALAMVVRGKRDAWQLVGEFSPEGGKRRGVGRGWNGTACRKTMTTSAFTSWVNQSGASGRITPGVVPSENARVLGDLS